MKKVGLLLVLIMIIMLNGCGDSAIAIEDYEWKMRTVMSNDIEDARDEDKLVIAVGEADELYPDAKIVELTLSAKDGRITVTDVTNNKTYNGSYKVQQNTPKSTDYEVTIDGLQGYATVAQTEYYDGMEEPTLPINLGEYALYFVPVD